ncbi:MAG: type II toxin-antitoxin system Phd/YefM family antitoxin [Thermodesulfobacteriota bacterium]
MIDLHPAILSKGGEKQFVVLPYEEFVALRELLADLEDLKELRVAKEAEGDAPVVSLAEARKALGL